MLGLLDFSLVPLLLLLSSASSPRRPMSVSACVWQRPAKEIIKPPLLHASPEISLSVCVAACGPCRNTPPGKSARLAQFCVTKPIVLRSGAAGRPENLFGLFRNAEIPTGSRGRCQHVCGSLLHKNSKNFLRASRKKVKTCLRASRNRVISVFFMVGDISKFW